MAVPTQPDQRARSYPAPASAATAITAGATVYSPGRALLISCTVSGTVIATLADGVSILTVTLPAAGIYEFNWAVTNVSASSTATATYYNLY